jgi:3-mercaptopyruvate sulfurtransferase SseA
MSRKTVFLAIALLILCASACEAQPTATPTLAPTLTPPPARLPATEAEVRRTTVEDVKAASDSGSAIILDVRSPAAFKMSHVAGALSIPLADIEANPAGLNLEKDQWIFTYCT